jgi:hypothetical protein
MIQDMITLGGAVSPIGGRIVFVASPPRAVAIDFWSYGPLPYPVLPSQALAPNDLIAIACNGLARGRCRAGSRGIEDCGPAHGG